MNPAGRQVFICYNASDKIAAIRALRQAQDGPPTQRKQRSDIIEGRRRDPVEISREIATRAEELRRAGVPNPVKQAEAEIAKRLGHASGPALNRWLRRHR